MTLSYPRLTLAAKGLSSCLLGLAGATVHAQGTTVRPNVLWITTEDISPHLGCYGDTYAYTPNLDRLAAEGVRFTHAFSTASVCTPSRSSIITGVYASSLGSQHLRGEVALSDSVPCFTELMRDDGYYTANFNKTDYNFPTPPAAWDYNGVAPHDSLLYHVQSWPEDKPFFAVYNFFLTHQSQTRYDSATLIAENAKLPPEARHDPALAPLPPYYPNTPAVRTNVAALHTQITKMDAQVGEVLADLDAAGLADKTIVIFYSDHGDGLPRHKRWLYHSGTQVPMIARFPPAYAHLAPVGPGGSYAGIVDFSDLAPTMLAITGVGVPARLPGNVFLGPSRQNKTYAFGILDRVDEVYEFCRSVTDGRVQYIRNYSNDKPVMPWSNYSEITPIRKEVRRLAALGQLDAATGWLMQATKPLEELYDVVADPHQMHNLATDTAYAKTLATLRDTLQAWMVASRDLSLMPEPEMRRLAGERSPRDVVAFSPAFPWAESAAMADLKGRGASHLPTLVAGLAHAAVPVRYWAASGLSAIPDLPTVATDALAAHLRDTSASVRIAAADALAKAGHLDAALPALGRELLDTNIVVRVYAAMSLLDLGAEAAAVLPYIERSEARPATFVPDRNFVTYIGDALRRVREQIGAPR